MWSETWKCMSGMNTSKNKIVRYSLDTNETVRHYNRWLTVHNCIITLYNLFSVVKNSPVQDPGQSLLNDNFAVVSIVKSTFKEWNGTIHNFVKRYWYPIITCIGLFFYFLSCTVLTFSWPRIRLKRNRYCKKPR